MRSDIQEINPVYATLLLVLSLVSLITVSWVLSGTLESETEKILTWLDAAICALFFVDYLRNIYQSKAKWQYIRGWGILDLLSCIPMIDALRYTRLLTLFRLFQAIRALKSARILYVAFRKFRTQNVTLAAALLVLFTLVFGALAVLQFETVEASNIKSAEDALWWSATTLTTVGYGDRFPVTTGGRVVASILMVIGIGMFGICSGLIAAYFFEEEKKAEHDQARLENLELKNMLQEIRAEVTSLRSELEKRSSEPH